MLGVFAKEKERPAKIWGVDFPTKIDVYWNYIQISMYSLDTKWVSLEFESN